MAGEVGSWFAESACPEFTPALWLAGASTCPGREAGWNWGGAVASRVHQAAVGIRKGENRTAQHLRSRAEAQRANPFQQVYFFVCQM
jgi:hypothetical protein